MKKSEDLVSKPRLRVGVIVDSLFQPAWVNYILSELNNSQIADLSVIAYIQNSENQLTKPADLRHFIYELTCKLDNILNKLENDSLRKEAIPEEIQSGKVLFVDTLQNNNGLIFQENDFLILSQYQLDLLIDFTLFLPDYRVSELTSMGIWGFHHGEDIKAPPGFNEVLEQTPTTACLLWKQTGPGQTTVMMTYCSATLKNSPRMNANHLYWSSTGLFKKLLTDLYEKGEIKCQTCSTPDVFNRGHSIPNNVPLFFSLFKFVLKKVAHKLESLLFFEQFEIGYFGGTLPTELNFPVSIFRELSPPGQLSWADPFIYSTGNEYYIFFEEWKDGVKGHISVLQMDSSGKVIKGPQPVLYRDYHLSYPFVFFYQDQIYMMPETGQNRAVELYLCQEFPNKWEYIGPQIENINAVDSTLLEHQGKWWLFINTLSEYGDEYFYHDELQIFYSDSPLGPWAPHKLNPVKLDVKSARSAGRIFCIDGNLYRPSQDCSVRYGYATVINKIVILSPEDYEEMEISKILPSGKKGGLGVHTLNFENDLTVIDLLVRRFKFR